MEGKRKRRVEWMGGKRGRRTWERLRELLVLVGLDISALDEEEELWLVSMMSCM
jgi:hypothetical protein